MAHIVWQPWGTRRPSVSAALLGPLQHLIVQVPKLPLGLTVRPVTVGPRGVVIGVAGRNVSFGQ